MSVILDPKLAPVAGARGGRVAAANLLEVLDVNGNQFYWADREIAAVPAIPAPLGLPAQLVPLLPSPTGYVTYRPYLLGVPTFTFHRSLVTDSGTFRIQNLSGTTLARDMEVQIRASALQGAFFIYRCWETQAEAAWLTVHGTLTLDPGGSMDMMKIKGRQLFNPAQDVTPLEILSETCQLIWAGKRCGSTQPTTCLYSFQSCQVIERPMLDLNSFEKNYGETSGNAPIQPINRSRRV